MAPQLFFGLAIVIGYLLGAISFSFVMGKILKGIDIRNHGSGNAGATNTLRVLGVGPGIAVLVLDALKGFAAIGIARSLYPDNTLVEVLTGLAAIVGHNWPVYFGFRGGKGVATTIGVMFTLAFLPTLYAGLIAVAAIALTRYVSLGSLLLTGLLPFLLYFMNRPGEIIAASVILAVFAFVRHRSNIVKLFQGTERKLGHKKEG